MKKGKKIKSLPYVQDKGEAGVPSKSQGEGGQRDGLPCPCEDRGKPRASGKERGDNTYQEEGKKQSG